MGPDCVPRIRMSFLLWTFGFSALAMMLKSVFVPPLLGVFLVFVHPPPGRTPPLRSVSDF